MEFEVTCEVLQFRSGECLIKHKFDVMGICETKLKSNTIKKIKWYEIGQRKCVGARKKVGPLMSN